MTSIIIKNKYFNKRIDIFLSNKIKNFSRNKIQKLIKNKKIYLNNKIINKNNTKIYPKDIIKIFIKKNKNKYLINKNIKINIIYEDKYLLIINKNKNIVVHPGIGHLNDTLMNKIMYLYPNNKNIPRYGIIHRLDKNTTGLLIIAKEINSYKILIKKLKKKKIIRIYKTLVNNNNINNSLKNFGIIKNYINRNKYNRKIMSITKKNGKKAITYFRIIEKFNFFTLLEIKLDTGRTHQIRVHMNYINNPIVGEKIYTKKRILNKKKISKLLKKKIKKLNRQALHATTLIFKHPINKNKIVINSQLPEDILDIIFLLRIEKKYNI